jgi:formate dehydrogenase
LAYGFALFSDSPGYGGDVWYPQPAPKDHPWRYMPNHAMTPHISGTTIDAQVVSCSLLIFLFHFICSIPSPWTFVQLRYAAGTKDMLERYFKGEEFPPQNYIVKEGKIASQYQ